VLAGDLNLGKKFESGRQKTLTAFLYEGIGWALFEELEKEKKPGGNGNLPKKMDLKRGRVKTSKGETI